ncbi:phosphatidate cytidylyltransferase [Kineococcus xinjiangensis]|uniref:Phosphatidate cytidylyltransferase n=1 Tax=Kineococcus xinjiangensis TaxID=512762 RepID=A0A2S6IW95_9ACTN|nr:phosphatidate cytidylyltransferase [Kineococcus xinjiangensis]PPK98510.1 phosphatidate cytidylyltransferase [Kineococcus xinjiangensis]
MASGVGIGLIALVVACLVIRKEAFVVLATVAVVLAVREMAVAFRARHLDVPVVPLVAGAVAIVPAAYVGGPESLFVSYALTVAAVLLWRLTGHTSPEPGVARVLPVADVAGAVFITTYAPFLAGFAMLMLAEPDGPWRILVFILCAVASDIGGFVAGVLFGRHPMAPSVSPKKSWEGMAGSVVLGAVTGAVAVPLALHGSWWVGALLGVAAVLSATVGDLSESLLKRDLGIKDMSNLIPEHGGIMDRLDSLLPTAPVIYLVLHLAVPT